MRRALIAFATVFVVVMVYFAVAAYFASPPARSAASLLSLRSAGQQPSSSPNAADIYTTNCRPCHGADGQGSDNGPSLKAAGSSSLVEPKVIEGGGGMPAFAEILDQQQIQAVSAYVAQEIADPTTHQATTGEGSDVWRLYCAPCHGSTGRGGALTSSENAPQLGGAVGADALVDMIEGPGEMPVFTAALTSRQQTSVALYVQNVIAEPPSPGGWGLGYLGPVPEGFFALFLGLGGLVVFARWAQGSERGNGV